MLVLYHDYAKFTTFSGVLVYAIIERMNTPQFLAATFFGFELPITQLFTYGAGVAVVLFAIPSYFSVLRQRGIFLGLVMLALLGALAVGFETFAVKAGVPYGKYAYDVVMGNKILGGAPWTVAVAFPIVILAAFWLASKVTHGFFRPFLVALFTVVSAVVLAPAAVKLELWKWENAGQFFGIPPLYFAGWAVAGLVSAWLIQIFWGDQRVRRGIAFSGMLAMVFWTGVNIGVNQWIPAAVGAAISILMILIMIWERRAEKEAKD